FRSGGGGGDAGRRRRTGLGSHRFGRGPAEVGGAPAVHEGTCSVILERILDAKREEVARRRQELPLGALAAAAASQAPPRGFRHALAARRTVGIIAEVKRRSPSKGPLREDLDPSALAQAYQDGGAACVSVLTDQPFFGGSPADLQAAKRAVSLPGLRKELVIDPYQASEARGWGGGAVLLTVAGLTS